MKTKHVLLAACVALAGGLLPGKADFILGSATNFAVLGNTTVTSTGNTVLNGNLGVYPGLVISGFPPGIVTNGAIYAGGTVAQVSGSRLTERISVQGAGAVGASAVRGIAHVWRTGLSQLPQFGDLPIPDQFPRLSPPPAGTYDHPHE